MGLKIWNIGKANSEIERLNVEVATITKERDDARLAMEGNNSEAVKAGEELQVQLTAAGKTIEGLNGQVSTLTTQGNSLKAELQTAKTELQAANDKLANPSAQIVKIAAIKAAEITGAQGQPPIVTTPAVTPAAETKEASGLFGLAKVQAAFKAQLAPKQ